MSLFYLIFFFIIAYLLFSIFKQRDFLKFLFALFGVLYEKNNRAVNEAVFLYEEPKLENLSREEAFALALGDLEHERLVSQLEEVDILSHLKQEWGLSFEDKKSKEHTLYTLQQIWSKGTLFLVFDNLHLEKEVGIADMVAFDAARFAELLRQVDYLKFLDEEELWGLLFLNAQRVQDTYKSAKEFKEAYLRGLTLYNYAKLEEKEHTFDFKKAYRQNQKSSNVEIVWLDEEIFSQFEKQKNEVL